MSESQYNDLFKRLDKIDNKLERLTDALITIGKIEEKQSNTDDSIKRVWDKIEKIEEKVDDLEVKSSTNKEGNRWLERLLLGGMGFGGILTGLISYFSKGSGS